MNTKLNELTQQEQSIFRRLAKAYAYQGITSICADHLPQRAGILSEFVDCGAEAYIAGGKDGQQYFKNIPQFTLPYDTFTSRDPSTIQAIADCLPREIAKNYVATFCYTPMGDRMWARSVQARLNKPLIATNEQNLRSYFEEKNNLEYILQLAGLEKHMIPSRVLRDSRPLGEVEARILYEKLKADNGKIVVQRCGEGNTEKGGGKSTEIVDNFEDFKKIVSAPRDCYLKVAKFITGSNSNLSICCGNTIPSPTMLGAVKGEILPEESRFSFDTLTGLLTRAQALGINKNNIIVNVQPATLKVVGAPQLTASNTNGVGNQLNYNFNPEIMEEIYSMGEKLGRFMALCGKTGLCGLDLIIDKDGNVFINELNDRQQGPTESASLNNEAHGLPGIHRESFIMNYADLNNPEIAGYLTQMSLHSREIYEESAKIPSPFYIKVCSLEDSYATTDIQAGDYAVSQNEQGTYAWDFSTSLDLPATPQVDITDERNIVRINTVSAKSGEFIPKDSQFLRINGIATPQTAPFTIDDRGVSVLSADWEKPIADLYDQVLQPTPVETASTLEDKYDQPQDSESPITMPVQQNVVDTLIKIQQASTSSTELSTNEDVAQ